MPPGVPDTSVLRRADQTIFAMMQLPFRGELVLKSFPHIFFGGDCIIPRSIPCSLAINGSIGTRNVGNNVENSAFVLSQHPAGLRIIFPGPELG